MKWTTEKPTLETAKSGEFYWFKGSTGSKPEAVRKFDKPTVVELYSNGHQLFTKLISEVRGLITLGGQISNLPRGYGLDR